MLDSYYPKKEGQNHPEKSTARAKKKWGKALDIVTNCRAGYNTPREEQKGHGSLRGSEFGANQTLTLSALPVLKHILIRMTS